MAAFWGWPGDATGRPAARAVRAGSLVATGYSNLEYRNGDYRYEPQAAQPSADGTGSHPYAAFDASGYGDDGYTDPRYQGPSAQDSGIAGTRTVRGFVEAGQGQSGYAPDAGYAQSSYLSGYERPGYAGLSYTAGGDIELAYPAGASDAYRGDLYQQPWDYDQPLRYDGEDQAYPVRGGYQQDSGYRGQDDGAERYQPPAFDPAAYNGSDYSMPGVNGPGYDLAWDHRHQRLRGRRLRRAGLRSPFLRRPALRPAPLRRAPVRRDPAGQSVAGRRRRCNKA